MYYVFAQLVNQLNIQVLIMPKNTYFSFFKPSSFLVY